MTTTATAKLIIESVLNHYFTPLGTQLILAADRSLESDKCFEWFYDSEHVMQAVQLFAAATCLQQASFTSRAGNLRQQRLARRSATCHASLVQA